MTKLGFSLTSFYFWPKRRLDFLLKNLNKTIPQATAIELSYFWPIQEIIKNAGWLKQYRYRSFHLPKTGYLKWVKILNRQQHLLKLDHLIIHPDMVKDWKFIKQSRIPFLAENMDNLKTKYRTLAEMDNLLKKYPNLKLCLDINHLKTNRQDVDYWLNQFNNQIAEIHLSGINRGYYKKWLNDKKILHSLCYFDRQVLNNLIIKKYPIILEGNLPNDNWQLLKKEFKLVSSKILANG